MSFVSRSSPPYKSIPMCSFVVEEVDPLPSAVLKEDLLLIEQSVLKKGPKALTTPIIFGYFPLHCAVAYDNYEMAKLLIHLNADVNAMSMPLTSLTSGSTPLWIAAMSVHSTAMTKLLMTHGAEIDSSITKEGRSFVAQMQKELEEDKTHRKMYESCSIS